MNYIIYKATNILSLKVYIGLTSKLLSIRKSQHKNAAFVKKSNLYFHKALRKHGLDNFIWECVEEGLSEKEANLREHFWINFYNSNISNYGYNLTSGGNHFKHNSETISKIKITVKKAMSTEEVKAKLSKANSEENNPQYGKIWSTQKRDNLSKKRGGVSFYVFEKESGSLVGVWNSRGQCAKDLDLHRENILSCLKGRHQSSKGYTFKYTK